MLFLNKEGLMANAENCCTKLKTDSFPTINEITCRKIFTQDVVPSHTSNLAQDF